MNYDYAKSLRLEAARQDRLSMIHQPHIRPLTDYVHDLRRRGLCEVPYFDPLDGGVDARYMFLFEKPGPKTSVEGSGSGFISRNNNDESAAATFAFMGKAGIDRKDTVLWNSIPGWNGTIKITADEARTGGELLAELIKLLPKLEAVVLVGRRAQRAWNKVGPQGFRVIHSPHPSPVVRASQPLLWNLIPKIWATVHGDDGIASIIRRMRRPKQSARLRPPFKARKPRGVLACHLLVRRKITIVY